MESKIRVIQWGIGAAGGNATRMMSQKQNFEVIGAIDTHPKKVGRDLGDIIGIDHKLGVIASDNVDEVLETEADVVLITTTGTINSYVDQFSKALKSKKNVVTTVGFSYPWHTHPEKSKQIDELAKEYGVSFLGTGVFPGLFSYLPPILTGGSARVDRVTAVYCDDLTPWPRADSLRVLLQIGISPDEFNEKKLMWVPKLYYEDVAHYIADVIGLQLTGMRLRWDTYVAKENLKTASMEIDLGKVCAWKVTVDGMKGNDVVVSVVYGVMVCPDRVAKQADYKPGFSFWIDGLPSLEVEIKEDLDRMVYVQTGAAAVNAIPLVVKAPPGLLSLNDLPPVTMIP